MLKSASECNTELLHHTHCIIVGAADGDNESDNGDNEE